MSLPNDPSWPSLKEVIARHDLRAQKKFGQNFLLDLNLTRKIARSAGTLQNGTIFEIGPGPGGLTRALLMEGAQHVVAIECDPRMLPVLDDLAHRFPQRFSFLLQDALALDWASLTASYSPPFQVVANLPYHIATPLLLTWLKVDPWPPWWESLTLMFQREVADRITAPCGNKTYGRLSVISQWRTEAVKLFDIGPQAFTPPPKVTSSLVRLVPKRDNAGTSSSHLLAPLERLTQAAFGQRRKMIKSSLKAALDDPQTFLADLSIPDHLRAEDLSVAQFQAMAQHLSNLEQTKRDLT